MSKTDELPDYVVTQEDYEADLALGLNEDEIMKPGVYKVRRSPWAKKLMEMEPNKIKVSIHLDQDVVQYFRSRADQTDAAPYQTQINNELRRIMENGSQDSKSIERDLLNDEEFLRELKKKLATV